VNPPRRAPTVPAVTPLRAFPAPATGHARYGRPFVARRAAVAAPHELASVAGLGILGRGGSAVDAMVAVNAALAVVYPHMTGVGGDAFWLVHDAATGRQHVLNATGRAAAGADPAVYAGDAIDFRGAASAITAPGTVDGWVQAHARFGRLPLAECLAPAIEYARDGFPVGGSLARFSIAALDLLRAFPATAAAYLKPGGAPYREGEILRSPRLADTLEAIAAGGREAFYEGAIARAIGDAVRAAGGVLSADDLAAHRSVWAEPLRVGYRGRVALAPPPNSQGFAALQILGLLEHVDVAGLADDPAAYVDRLVRATALAFQDRDRHLTDPDHMDVDARDLLDPEYLAERADGLRDDAPARALAAPAVAGDTTFSCAVDADGNAAGVIQSIYAEWGSGLVAGDTGVLLQNRGCAFSLDPSHPNVLAPGKRTAHTLTAGMLLGPGGDPELVYGTMGGEGQPQTSAAIVTRVVDHGLDPQAALDAPRWLLGRNWGEEHRGLRLEGRFGPGVARELTARGHENVTLVDDVTELVGHAQAIAIRPGRLEAAADPRSDGAALGF
jgi:gamma-glutamyltranspeptidase